MTALFVVAACVLVLRDDRVLALRRAATKDIGAGLWEALSGRVEVDEEPLDAGRREVVEESGLDVELETRPWTAYRTLRGDRPMIVLVYRARYRSGRLRLSNEHDGHAWVDADGFAALSPLPPLVAAVRSALVASPEGVMGFPPTDGRGGAAPEAAARDGTEAASRAAPSESSGLKVGADQLTQPLGPSRAARIDRPTLFARLRDLDLPAGDWVVHGSGSMLAHELIDDAGDIDVVARGAAWEAAAARGQVVQEHWDRKVALPGGIDVFDGWGPFDRDALLAGAVDIEGVPCTRLRDVLAFKRWVARPKDRPHIEVLERFVADAPER